MDNETVAIKKLDVFALKSEKLISYSILIIFTAIFGFLSVESIWHTSVFDPDKILYETILYNYDNVFINLLIIGVVTFILYVTKRYWEKFNLKVLTLIAYAFIIAIGFIWVFSVKSVPTEDSYTVTNNAKLFLEGNYENLMYIEGYFNKYPFQLGFTFLCELYYKITGSDDTLILQAINVLGVCFTFGALQKINRYLFDNDKLQILTTILMMGCIQPIIFSTFVYGNILGYAFSIWAVVFEMRYLKSGKKYNMFISALLIAIGTLLKLNSMIVLVAMVIIMFVHLLKNRKIFDIVSIVICVVLANTLNSVVIMQYENRAGIQLSDGVPKICWLNMGLNESPAAPGWYNPNTGPAFYSNNNYDGEIATEKTLVSIKERLEFFKDNPDYTNEFFNKKTVSQWNEPTYQSIWSSQVRGFIEPVPEFVQNIYTGDANTNVTNYMSRYQELIFLFTFISALYMFKNKKLNMLHVSLMLIILGGFFYHLLFEAKSQYIVIYFVTCVPIAGYGLFSFLESIQKRINKTPNAEVLVGISESSEEQLDSSEVQLSFWEEQPDLLEEQLDLSEQPDLLEEQRDLLKEQLELVKQQSKSPEQKLDLQKLNLSEDFPDLFEQESSDSEEQPDLSEETED